MRNTITSRVNGIKIAVPPNARGVLRRFNTKGDNELVFESGATPRTDFGESKKPVKIGKTEKSEESLA